MNGPRSVSTEVGVYGRVEGQGECPVDGVKERGGRVGRAGKSHYARPFGALPSNGF